MESELIKDAYKPLDEEVMDMAILAGHILLENGAEIFRVEETITRICEHYGVHSGNAFVLSNGIFATSGSKVEHIFAKVQHIPVRGANLSKVAAVNDLSREIEKNHYTVEEAKEKLLEIQNMPEKSKIAQTVAAGIGSAAFCYLFGGNLTDSFCALITGLVLYIFVLYINKGRLSKIVSNILGGMILTGVCGFFYRMGISRHLNFMIMGSIMPLIPGVAFTNAIREIGDGDYISGAVRMLDALLVFICIAIGVGVGISLLSRLTGGIYL